MRAADMRYWWALLILVPYVGGFIYFIILWIKLSHACDKSPWWTIPALIPVVQVGVTIYYAFSDSGESYPRAAQSPGEGQHYDEGERRTGLNLYLIGGVAAALVIVLALPLLLRGNASDTEDAAEEAITISAPAPESPGRPSGFPADIPIYPEMEYYQSEEWMMEGGLATLFLTKQTESDVIAFYDAAFLGQGYHKGGPEYNPLFGGALYAYTLGERMILMVIGPDTEARPGQGYLGVSFLTVVEQDYASIPATTSSLSLPPGFPQDVPVFPNMHLTVAESTGAGFQLEGISHDTADAIKAFYESGMLNFGWQGGSFGTTELSFMGTHEKRHHFGFTKDNRSATVAIVIKSNITAVEISIEPR